MIIITEVKINKFDTNIETETGSAWNHLIWTIDKLIWDKKIDTNILEAIIIQINSFSDKEFEEYRISRRKMILEGFKNDYIKNHGNTKIDWLSIPPEKIDKWTREDELQICHLWLQFALEKLERTDITAEIYDLHNKRALTEEDAYRSIMIRKSVELVEKGYLKFIDNEEDDTKSPLVPTNLGRKRLSKKQIEFYENHFNGSGIAKSDVIYLHDTSGLTFQKISERTGVPRTTLQNWYNVYKNKNNKRLGDLIKK